jgi:hypothetical protein
VDEKSPISALPPALLERIRRGFPLRLDAMGRFLFEEDEITHPGVIELFRDGIDRNDEGELILRVGEQWTYLNPSDCPLRVLAVDAGVDDGAPPTLVLDDGRKLALDWGTLVEDEGRGLRCQVPSKGSGRPLDARLNNAAALVLSDWLEVDDEGRATVQHGGETLVIPFVAAN